MRIRQRRLSASELTVFKFSLITQLYKLFFLIQWIMLLDSESYNPIYCCNPVNHIRRKSISQSKDTSAILLVL